MQNSQSSHPMHKFVANFVGTNKELREQILLTFGKQMGMEAVKKMRQRAKRRRVKFVVRFVVNEDGSAVAHLVGGATYCEVGRDMVGTLMGGLGVGV